MKKLYLHLFVLVGASFMMLSGGGTAAAAPPSCGTNQICLYDGTNFSGEVVSISASGSYLDTYIYLSTAYSGITFDFQDKLTSVINNSPYTISLGYNGGTESVSGYGSADYTGQSIDNTIYYLRIDSSTAGSPPTAVPSVTATPPPTASECPANQLCLFDGANYTGTTLQIDATNTDYHNEYLYLSLVYSGVAFDFPSQLSLFVNNSPYPVTLGSGNGTMEVAANSTADLSNTPFDNTVYYFTITNSGTPPDTPNETCTVDQICLYDAAGYTGTPLIIDATDPANQTGYIYLSLNYSGNTVDFPNKLTSLINNSAFQVTLSAPNDSVIVNAESQIDFAEIEQGMDNRVYYLAISVPDNPNPPTSGTCDENEICLYDEANYAGTPLVLDASDPQYADSIVYLTLAYSGITVDFPNKLSSIINNSAYEIVLGAGNGSETLNPNAQRDLSGQAIDNQVYYLNIKTVMDTPTPTDSCTAADLANSTLDDLIVLLETATFDCVQAVGERGTQLDRDGFLVRLNQILENPGTADQTFIGNISIVIDFYYVPENCGASLATSSLTGLANIFTDSRYSEYGSSARFRTVGVWGRIVARKGSITPADFAIISQTLTDPDPNLVSYMAFRLRDVFRAHLVLDPSDPCWLDMQVSLSDFVPLLQNALMNNTYSAESPAVKISEAKLYIAYALDYLETNSPDLPDSDDWLDDQRAKFETDYLQSPVPCTVDENTVQIQMPVDPTSDLGAADPSTICGMLNDVFNSYVTVMNGLPTSDDSDNEVYLIIFGSNAEYRTYADLSGFGSATNAGGVYFDYPKVPNTNRNNTLFTYDRNSPTYAFSLEHLIKHEFVHFLTNRYNFPGRWAEYANTQALYDEGLAEYIAFHTNNPDSPIPPNITYKNTVCQVPPEQYDLAGLLGSTNVLYQNFYSFVYYLYTTRQTEFDTIFAAHGTQQYSFENDTVTAGNTTIPISSWSTWYDMLNGNDWCATNPSPLQTDDNGNTFSLATSLPQNNEGMVAILNNSQDADVFAITPEEDGLFIVRVDSATTGEPFNIEIVDDEGNVIVNDSYDGSLRLKTNHRRFLGEYFVVIDGEAGKTYYVTLSTSRRLQPLHLTISSGDPMNTAELEALNAASLGTTPLAIGINVQSVQSVHSVSYTLIITLVLSLLACSIYARRSI